MKKETIKSALFTTIYLILGAGSFIAAGMFLNQAFIDSNKDHVIRALLFCGLGLFWTFMFGEKRRQAALREIEKNEELFFGMEKTEDEEID